MNLFIDSIIRVPAILLAIIAGIGLSVQKKKLGDILKGMFLTAFGMLILETGTGILVGSILPINEAFQTLSTTKAAAEGLNAVTFTAKYGGIVGSVMVIALIIHLLIARFTRLKVIFLTGHFIWWFPFIFVAACVEGGLRGSALIGVAAVITALYMSIMPWIVRKYIFAVIGDESFTLGHSSSILCLIAGFVASKVGNKENSTEDIQVPQSLSFFREVSISGSIVLMIVFIVVGIFIPALTPEGEVLIIYTLKKGLAFGAGLTIMLNGVRMLISQIVPAFKGISEKIVPDAIPGFDCPLLFNYRPNAVIIGFIVAMTTSTILMIISNTFNVFGVILVPMVIISFFECGAAAVVADAQGGLRGAIIGTFCAACAVVGLVGISAAMTYSNTIQNWILIFGGNDISLFGTITKYIISAFTSI